MLLVIDVGNTNVVVGVFRGEELLDHWRMSTIRDRTTDEYGVTIMNLFRFNGLNPEDVEAVIISSVVPPLMPAMERVSLRYFDTEPVIVGPGTKTGMPIKYDNPREVGADRIVNAVSAYEKYGGPLIVIDFGTATTYCVINEKGEYLGGAIAPGIAISAEALFQRAAKLPRIEIRNPGQVICKNTVSSMQSGILFGYVGQVEGIVERMKRDIQGKPRVVATGGLATLIASETDCIDVVEPLLTLKGLRLLYEKNK